MWTEKRLKMKYTARRISKGHYLYRGYRINCVGYYAPDRHRCWEAVDKDGTGFAHSYSLKMTKALVDDEVTRKERGEEDGW